MENSLKNIYLITSQGCNLSCTYCYAKGGDFGRGQLLMERATMEKALDKLLPLSGDRCVISFFGGEPLLNFDLMKDTVVYGRGLSKEKDIDLIYSITTNGTILNEDILSFLKEHISHIAVSLDGDSWINDTHRLFKGDGGSVHDVVIENIKKLKGNGISFGIRCTVTEATVPFLAGTVNYLEGLGSNSLRIVPVISSKGWSAKPFRILIDKLNILNLESLSMVFNRGRPAIAEHIYKAISYLLDSKNRLYPCMAGEEVVAVAANGDVYPCDHLIGIDDFLMGNVHDLSFPGGRFYSVRDRLRKNSVDHRESCRECELRYLCGGECYARSLLIRGDIAAPSPEHCTLTKSLAKSIIAETKEGITDKVKKENLFRFLGKA